MFSFGQSQAPSNVSSGAQTGDLNLKKVIENFLTDLRLTASETKRKYPNIKELCDASILKIRSIQTNKPIDLAAGIREVSSELIEPFLLAVDVRVARLNQISLQAVQKLIVASLISQLAASKVVDMMGVLVEMEALKVLQTLLQLVTTDTIVVKGALQRAIAICTNLTFSKEPVIANTAEATVKQLVNTIFDRIDDRKMKEKGGGGTRETIGSGSSPEELFPEQSVFLHDAECFLKDLCTNVTNEQTHLRTTSEVSPSLGIEILENVLHIYHRKLTACPTLMLVVKDNVCKLVLKMLSPCCTKLKSGASIADQQQQSSISSSSSGGAGGDVQFGLLVRLLRIVHILVSRYMDCLLMECEIFLSHLVRFLHSQSPQWLKVLSCEIVHYIIAQPSLVSGICEKYDLKSSSTKIYADIVTSIGQLAQNQFALCYSTSASQTSGNNSGTATMVTSDVSFFYKGVTIPILCNPQGTSMKNMYVDGMDRSDMPSIPESYSVSLSYICVLDIVRSLNHIFAEQLTPHISATTATDIQREGEKDEDGGLAVEGYSEQDVSQQQQTPLVQVVGGENGAGRLSFSQLVDGERKRLLHELVASSWLGIMPPLCLFLEAASDQPVVDTVLKAFQILVKLSGEIGLVSSRDAFIAYLCKACLPSSYAPLFLESFDVSNNTPQSIAALFKFTEENKNANSQIVAISHALAVPGRTSPQNVSLTSKNLQCMNAVLRVTAEHGASFDTSWNFVLKTLEHFVWILCLKPSTGGLLKAATSMGEKSNTVITAVALSEIPDLTMRLSKVFTSTKDLEKEQLDHVIGALISISNCALQSAASMKEPSLFGPAKLLETGLVNLFRVDCLWDTLSSHFLQLCRNGNAYLRCYAADAFTQLVRSALCHNIRNEQQTGDQKLQLDLLNPLSSMCTIHYPDVRLKQLECVHQILQTNGQQLVCGWPILLQVIESFDVEPSCDGLVKTAFVSLQLVVSDFLHSLPASSLLQCINAASKFGNQRVELNISLTAVEILWNVSDYIFNNYKSIEADLGKDKQASHTQKVNDYILALFVKLADLCCDERPPVRKSAAQTLFGTINVHSSSMDVHFWHTVVWTVLFTLLTEVSKSYTVACADVVKKDLLVHHSRDTPEKQWSETVVLCLSGVCKIFVSFHHTLFNVSGFEEIWKTLTNELRQFCALCKNNEVTNAAIKCFQDLVEVLGTVSNDVKLWTPIWAAWVGMGKELLAPTNLPANSANLKKSLFVPSQQFLTIYVTQFVPIFKALKKVFTKNDLESFGLYLTATVSIPLPGDSTAIFMLASNPDCNGMSPLQTTVINCLTTTASHILDGSPPGGGGSNQDWPLLPTLYALLNNLSTFACEVPPFGGGGNPGVKTRIIDLNVPATYRASANANSNSSGHELVQVSCTVFSEKCLRLVVELYAKTHSSTRVVKEKIMQRIVAACRRPLAMKYACSSKSTWKCALAALMKVIITGLPVATQPANEELFREMWVELADCIEEFLFPKTSAPANMSLEEHQSDESYDVQLINLISSEVLPCARSIPKQFVARIMEMLNRGSIHSAANASFLDAELGRKLREDLARTCFHTLLHFSFSEENNAASGKGVGVSEESAITRLALEALLTRCAQVLTKFVEDERKSGKLPLPKPRLVELAFVLKAIATFLQSLSSITASNSTLLSTPNSGRGGGRVDEHIWQMVFDLYPLLLNLTATNATQVHPMVRDVLHEYRPFLSSAPTSLSSAPLSSA